MQYLLVILIIALSVSHSGTLVFFKQLAKGKDGCKTDKAELKVGEFIQEDKVCGIMRCEDKEGKALIMYCQVPFPFAKCLSQFIDTTTSFPKCCWTCVNEKWC